jgi:ABC-2 type transport system ATP-binding protein
VLAEPRPTGFGPYDRVDDHTLRVRVDDIAAELPGHLQALAKAGIAVRDVRVESPSLQAVFIHLTGHELRE